jgi:hypothetical protein
MPNATPVGRRVPVTFNALLQRLIRRLIKDDRTIHSPKGRAERAELGSYYLVDLKKNVVVETKLTPAKLEAMARQLEVLEAWEEVK